MLTLKIEINGRRIATLTAKQTLLLGYGVAEYEWKYIEEGIGGERLLHYTENGALALAALLINQAELLRPLSKFTQEEG